MKRWKRNLTIGLAAAGISISGGEAIGRKVSENNARKKALISLQERKAKEANEKRRLVQLETEKLYSEVAETNSAQRASLIKTRYKNSQKIFPDLLLPESAAAMVDAIAKAHQEQGINLTYLNLDSSIIALEYYLKKPEIMDLFLKNYWTKSDTPRQRTNIVKNSRFGQRLWDEVGLKVPWNILDQKIQSTRQPIILRLSLLPLPIKSNILTAYGITPKTQPPKVKQRSSQKNISS